MNILSRIIFLGLVFYLQSTSYGQALIKETTILTYGIHDQDSVLRSRKTSSYDSLGRLINKHNYYYQANLGRLAKEEKTFFNTQTNWLTEHIITYALNKEPLVQKLKTKYLDYRKEERDSKYVLRQLYDQYGELSKEDTLTYDENQNLIALCKYNYRGSTSLFCDYYTYKNNLQTRWKTYSKWTTINARGLVDERQAKRRDFCYKYNKNGQLIRVCGKHYKTRFRQDIKYDENNLMLENKSTVKRRVRQQGTKEKPAKKKYRINKEEKILTYKNGLLIKDVKLLNKKEVNQKEIVYQDSLIKTVEISLNGVLVEEIEYEYDQAQLTKKIDNKYHKDGRLRYSITTSYNLKGDPIREEQTMGAKSLSILEIEYDKHRNPISQSLSAKNSKSSEKTLYIYKYYCTTLN